ncbi:uncharacterized protein LOC123892656 [Trifolium pratense]|uniref:uncharacterized protein LOC123892656 n=1 Tax=Trifolium pratense TaxID=57577 RepID=UPI000842D313|nr:uncharacterized protein LOC123892656 [Trifolium pratense]
MMEEPNSSLSELIVSLEQATFMAKQLSSNSTNPTHLNQIHNSLHQTHHHLTSFLSTFQSPPVLENSVSSANGAAPMQLGDDEEEEDEETSKCTIDKVEQQLRDCFIKNKRPKRPLSPSTVARVEEKRFSNDGFVKGYDPHAVKLRALDLVYQFHG